MSDPMDGRAVAALAVLDLREILLSLAKIGDKNGTSSSHGPVMPRPGTYLLNDTANPTANPTL